MHDSPDKPRHKQELHQETKPIILMLIYSYLNTQSSCKPKLTSNQNPCIKQAQTAIVLSVTLDWHDFPIGVKFDPYNTKLLFNNACNQEN